MKDQPNQGATGLKAGALIKVTIDAAKGGPAQIVIFPG
jgi:hypothetical protein